jgi:DNA ligase-1
MNESAMTLGTDYDGQDPLGWYVTEKLRDVRAYWDGSKFWTRGGNIIEAPKWLTDGLPNVPLDGGIYAGRCKVETVARLAVQNNRWIEGVHQFRIYDSPAHIGTHPERMAIAAAAVRHCPHARVVAVDTIKDRREVMSRLLGVLDDGGEGLMLRNPDVIFYEQGRTRNLLKVKAVHPAMSLCKYTKPRRARGGKLPAVVYPQT